MLVVQVNGKHSGSFAIEWLSPLLCVLVLVLEPLVQKLRDKGSGLVLHGVPFASGFTAKVSVYIDDITVFMVAKSAGAVE